MSKVYIARNNVRPIVYKFAKRITPANADLVKASPINQYRYEEGESFQVDEEHLQSLLKAYPNEIEYNENLVPKEELAKKDEEISKLKSLLKRSKSKK